MVDLAIKILILICKLLSKAELHLKVLARNIWYRYWPPMSQQGALDAAFVTLRGRILEAVPYRNIGSGHILIAALRSEDDFGGGARVHLLEEFAGTYRELFRSEQLYGPPAVAVEDIDKDGLKEILFRSLSLGTAFWSKTLFLYVPAQCSVYAVRAEYNWVAPHRPNVRVSIVPDPKDQIDRKWIKILEEKSVSWEILEPMQKADLNDPNYAVIRWHKDNGLLETGQVRFHRYNGPPICRASITATIDDGDTIWKGYFKGPVYGYIPSKDEHFVLYSPRDAYLWPTCLLAEGRFLWIGTHGNGIIRYDKKSGCLHRIVLKFEGKEVLDIESIRRIGSHFDVNNTALFDASELES